VASALLAGFLLGFTIAASPGPIALLCVRRTLARGWPEGVASGLGAATADGCYGGLAAFGMAAITHLLVSERRWLGLAGGLVLLAVGVRGVIDRSIPEPRPAGGAATLVGAYGSVTGLTMANPQTIISFAAAFGMVGALGGFVPLGLTVGVLAGSAAWWAVLTGAVALVRKRLGIEALRLLRTASGGLLAVVGMVATLIAIAAR
jgi:threonine/homoserine/homoserine lactone efflux protein